MNQNRLKSPVVWSTIATGLFAILGEWGLYGTTGLNEEVLQHTQAPEHKDSSAV